MQWYDQDKAVPVQSNTAHQDVNVPLEGKLAQTGLDSPPPSRLKLLKFLCDGQAHGPPMPRPCYLLIGQHGSLQRDFNFGPVPVWVRLTSVNIRAGPFVSLSTLWFNKQNNIKMFFSPRPQRHPNCTFRRVQIMVPICEQQSVLLSYGHYGKEKTSRVLVKGYERGVCYPTQVLCILALGKWRQDSASGVLCELHTGLSPSPCFGVSMYAIRTWRTRNNRSDAPPVCSSHEHLNTRRYRFSLYYFIIVIIII